MQKQQKTILNEDVSTFTQQYHCRGLTTALENNYMEPNFLKN